MENGWAKQKSWGREARHIRCRAFGKHQIYPSCAGIAIAFSLLTVPAQAQDNDGLYWADRLNGITITATRVPVEIVDAPATVTVISDKEIADNLVTDIKDLVRFEPGISVRRAPARFGAALGATGRAGNEDFNIRGIGGNRVLIQVDGIRSPQGFSFGAQDAGRGGYTDIGLVKSVEILRGPGSALYGSDGLSGVVSFTTSDPVDLIDAGAAIGGFVRAQFSSADHEFAETAALAGRSGNWSAMLAYTRRDYEELQNKGKVGGQGEERTEPNPQDGRSNALLGKLVWSQGSHRVRLTGEYLKSKVFTDVLSGQGPVFLYGPSPSWNVDDLTADDSTKRTRVSLDWTWEGSGPIDFAHVAVYWQDGKDVQFTDEDRSSVDATPRPDRERLNTFENRVYGLTAEARSDFGTGVVGHRLAYGGDVSWTLQKGLRDGVEPPVGETFPTRAFPETDFTLGGIFLGDEISLLDGRFTIYPALRYDFYKLDPVVDPLLPNFIAEGQKDSQLSPKIGAVAKIGRTVRLFANYAQGFRAPTPSQVNNFFENLAYGYTSAPNPDLGPERSESWEGGVRLNGDSVGLAITAFQADYRDFIDQQVISGAFTPTDPAVYQWVNVGRVKVKGIEAKADFQSRNGFTGRFAVAYAKGTEKLSGGGNQPLASIDPLNFVLGLGYRDPGNRFGGELIATHHARKEAGQARGSCSEDECYRPDAFTIVDATAFLRIVEALTLRAGIFNLTDETYAYWSDVRGLSAGSSVTDAYTRPGRNASVSLSYRF
ncbi:TonB-dependent hemoglobin/transferrin/lactoferrin family receptor [Croceicoccus bisphenolivorans]|uniref:TonB-dependent hemoglobin/transferrin/lactoferrin family receptor n=1 Tax=Croceicoccus bisphenolivorans TaxID=1783232 RepID=UPI0009ECE715|nr:TonB-dependent hemoglobin/transferrin/lactoferrin family receptor [Croceicoccus bisphenolivorans]